MAQTLQNLSKISFTISGVCFVLAVFLWFFFKIPMVIGDLSGKTARKSIADMRAANERSGIKFYGESRTNSERGKLTGLMTGTFKTKKKKTEQLKKNPAKSVTVKDAPETTLLAENKAETLKTQATGLLEAETTGLLVDEDATAPLVDMSNRISVRSKAKKFEMIDEVILIHTDEVIAEKK